MTVDCMRIVTDGDLLGFVKDTCEGCKINSKTCAINDALEDLGVLANWAKWDTQNYRERRANERL